METFEDELVLGFRSPNGNNEHLKPSIQRMEPQWIPEGFRLESEIQKSNYISYYYVSGQEYIDITLYFSESVSSTADIEDALVEDLIINENQAKLISKLGEFDIVWGSEKEKYIMLVSTCGVSKDEIIKIAENILIV